MVLPKTLVGGPVGVVLVELAEGPEPLVERPSVVAPKELIELPLVVFTGALAGVSRIAVTRETAL